MNLLRAYARSLCVVIVLGITTFSSASSADGTSTGLLVAFALPVAVGAWWLSVRHRMLLPRAVVNLLLLAVLAYAALQAAARRFDVDSVAQLVIFIQLIKLGDRRAPRDDAQIMSLSVFLAIAAMLTSNGFWVGLQLILFIPVLIATVMLFQLYSGWFQAQGAAALASTTRARIPEPESQPGAGGRFRATILFATITTVAMGALVFVIMPRGVGENSLGAWPTTTNRSVTGFTDHVRLGSRSVISQSPKVVLDMVVRESSGADGEPGMNLGTPTSVYYLRGAVLDKYERGAWVADQREERPEYAQQPLGLEVILEPRTRAAIMQFISIREMDAKRAPVFTLWRPLELRFDRETTRIDISASDRTFRRTGRPGPVQYSVWSGVIERTADEDAPRTPTDFPSERIHGLAASILAGQNIDPDPASRPVSEDLRAARAIQDNLQRGYAYTLIEPGVPPGQDPIEHFLFQSKEGHCEYFAAAMVAMCRSVGVNARMIAGYLAAEFDEATGRYVVRESNAHAWVEAEAGRGHWRRFDPTPPEDLTRLHQAKPGLMSRLRRALDSMEYAWNTSIVGFDQGAQQRLLGPGGEQGGFLDALASRMRGVGHRAMLGALGRGIAVFVIVAAAGLSLRTLILLLRRRLPRLRFRGFARSATPRFAAAQARFYQQLLDVLRRRGHPKPLWRPPLDHAAALETTDARLAAATREVAGLFYRARFGGRPATETELAAAKALLADLAHADRRGR